MKRSLNKMRGVYLGTETITGSSDLYKERKKYILSSNVSTY